MDPALRECEDVNGTAALHGKHALSSSTQENVKSAVSV